MVTNTIEIGTALRPLRRVTRAARTAVSPRTPRPATHRTRLPGQAPRVPALAASLLVARAARRVPRAPIPVAFALAVLAVLATVAPEQAAAQTVTTLLSNTGQTFIHASIAVRATAFTTGTGTYTLSGVGIELSIQPSGIIPVVQIYGDTSGLPGTPEATMTNPGTIVDNALNIFTAPANTTLAAGTTYWVVTSNSAATDGTGVFVRTITNNNTDSGTAAGWSIGDARLKNDIADTSWSTTDRRHGFQIRGTDRTVPADWSLKPTGLTAGAKFRLLFLSSTKRDATATDIATYNTFVQNRAAAGHADIRAYSTVFRAVGCTADTDARDNTATTYTTADTGVPIYWLNGAKAADDYADFYDGDWDDEANDKNESGTDGPDTSQLANQPWTGCNHNGTKSVFSGTPRALGSASVRVGRPADSGQDNGPIGSISTHSRTQTRPLYGLSEVFQVAAAVVVPNNPPTFSADTAARSVAENTAAGQNVGAALTATDADSDTLTYTLEGTDAASFDIVSGSGQIRTRTGVTYARRNEGLQDVPRSRLGQPDGGGGRAAFHPWQSDVGRSRAHRCGDDRREDRF